MFQVKKGLAFLLTVMMICSIVMVGCSNQETGSSDASPAAADEPTETAEPAIPAPEVYDNGLSKTEEVNLKFIAIESGYGRDPFEVPVQKFMEMFPNVHIDLTLSPTAGEVINAKISAKDDNDMFDLIIHPTGYSNQLASDGYVEPLDDVLKANTWDDPGVTLQDDIYLTTLPKFSFEGKLYQLPLDIGQLGILYNKKMFKENNWNEAPATWSEFLQLSETILQSQKAVPFTFAGIYSFYADFAFQTASIYAGGQGWLEKFLERPAGIYSDPATLAPHNKWAEYVEKGYVLKGSEGLDHTSSQMEFLQGEAAMIPGGAWIENEMKDSTPEGFEYGFMIPPMNDNPTDDKYVNGSANGLWMWAKKPDLQKQWTKEFIRYYYSKENSTVLIKNGAFPSVKSALTEENANVAAPLMKEMLTKMSSGNMDVLIGVHRILPLKLQASQFTSEATDNIYSPGYLAIYLKQSTPEQIGKEMDEALEKAWTEVGGR